MKIRINDKRKVFMVQEEFNTLFPYLKLEFFSRPYTTGSAFIKRPLKYSGKTLGECRTTHTKGTITITPGMSVAELEERFRNVFGLHVQVFRKSGNIWLETTVTDEWSLEEQNQQGEALSKLAV